MTRRTKLASENNTIRRFHCGKSQERVFGTVRAWRGRRQRKIVGVLLRARGHRGGHPDFLPTVPVDRNEVWSTVAEVCLREGIAERVCRTVVALAEAAD